MLALYGHAEHHSPLVAVLGLGLLGAGVIAALLSLRGTTFVRPHPLVLLGAALGVALHGYEQASASDTLAVGWLLWALVPYALGAGRLRRSRRCACRRSPASRSSSCSTSTSTTPSS